MRIAIPVISSLFLSLLASGGTQPAPIQQRILSAPIEPSGPLSAEASLLSLRETSEGRTAVLRIDVVAHEVDLDATVTPLRDDRVTPQGPAIARVRLAAEWRRSVIVEATAPADRETHLFYRVSGRRRDGTTTELNVSYRVPPDDADACQAVGEYLECAGEIVPEVEP